MWAQKGIKCVGDLYIHLYIQGASFSQLQQKFGLGSSSFYQYLQIRHYMCRILKDFQTEESTLIVNALKR